MIRPLPEHLRDAYDWTHAAGELDELRLLQGDALEAYVMESAGNNATHRAELGQAPDVYADELRELGRWLRESGEGAA